MAATSDRRAAHEMVSHDGIGEEAALAGQPKGARLVRFMAA